MISYHGLSYFTTISPRFAIFVFLSLLCAASLRTHHRRSGRKPLELVVHKSTIDRMPDGCLNFIDYVPSIQLFPLRGDKAGKGRAVLKKSIRNLKSIKK